MTSVFDDPDGCFHVLVNDEGQYSLWPAFSRIPAGWSAARENADLQSCQDFIEAHWTDMRPRTLATQH